MQPIRTLEVDARGLSCPMPLLQMRRALAGLQPGERVHVLATDPGSWRDFHSFAELSGNHLLSAREQGGEFEYLLEKAGD